MRGRLLVAIAFCFVSFAADAPAQQRDTRVALIIANEAYISPDLGRLPGTQRDAAVMEAALRQAGFTEIAVERNLDRASMRRALSTFQNRLLVLGRRGVGFLYYTGHGVADADDSGGRNYLIPVDARITSAVDYPVMAISLADELSSINRTQSRAVVIVIDACRNMPRSLARGVRGFIPEPARTNTLVAFSTSPGETAEDNGLYAQTLARRLAEPGLEVETVFTRVQRDVNQATGGRQQPRFDSGLVEPVVFTPDQVASQHAPPIREPVPTTTPQQPAGPVVQRRQTEENRLGNAAVDFIEQLARRRNGQVEENAAGGDKPASDSDSGCIPGFFWRLARPADLVCVTEQSRRQVSFENSTNASRVNPNGAYGPATCVSGYVWREAFDGDVVCVTPARRDEVRGENRDAASRRR